MTEVVKDILNIKNNEVWTTGPEDTVYDSISLMADKKVGALVVTEGTKVLGIITERDYTHKVILQGKASKNTPVRDIMTDRAIYMCSRTRKSKSAWYS